MECIIPSVDLYAREFQQNDILSAFFEVVTPVNSIESTRTIQFKVNASDEFLDLQNSFIAFEVEVKGTGNANLAADVEVALANYPIVSLFRQVDVFLNNDLVTSTINYHYRGYMESTFTFSKEAKKTWLTCGGYSKDTLGQMNTLTDANLGFKERKELCKGSRKFWIVGKVHSELFNQSKLILNRTEFKIDFHRVEDAFVLMCAANAEAKVNIVSANFHIRKCTLADSKIVEYERALMTTPIPYEVTKVVVRSFTHGGAKESIDITNLSSSDILPDRIIVALVDNTAYTGTKAENPFNFKHFNTSSVDIRHNSLSLYGGPIVVAPARGEVTNLLWEHYQAIRHVGKNDTNSISKKDFTGGYFAICSCTQPSLPNGEYRDPVQKGSLTLNLRFSTALPHSVTVIVYLEYEGIITLNQERRAVPI